MARILSESFIKYQRAEEAEILRIGDELDDHGKECVQQLYAPLKITSEDLSRVYSPSEVKQLCLRTKVQVNMTLFNCVWEAKQRLGKKGRLANRSERFVNAMLVKAVARGMVIPYTPEEISKCNHIRECQLKKFNNNRLNRWRNESSQGSVLECSHPNQSSLLPPAQVVQTELSDIPLNFIAAIDSEALLTQPEMWVDGETPEIPAKSKDVAQAIDASIESIPDMAWVKAAANINTDSISVGMDSELNTQQTESQPVVLSNEDYERFGTQVPATSTQTQCTEPFL